MKINFKIKDMYRSILSVSIIFLFNACTKVGPDYVKPAKQNLPTSWDSNSSKNNDIKEWWKLFNDKTLNILVEKALGQNLDLRGAGLRILQARTNLGISQSLNYPQVQTLSGSIAGVKKNGNNFLNLGVNFDVGWEIDIWGKYARGIESSEATLYANIASYDDILVTIISEIARNYINYRTAEERLIFAKRNIVIQKRVAKITQIQFNAGNVSELDVQQAKTQLYGTMSILPSYEFSMLKSQTAIAILLGTLPQKIESILNYKLKDSPYNMGSNNRDYKAQSVIPILVIDKNFKIDANLVSRRPDIKMAEFQAIAQNARIGSAEAELYPHFSLFGTIGYNTQNSLGEFISAGDAIGITAGPSFNWNIFNYGRIKDQIRFQDAKFQESINNYNKKVLLAVQEVTNSLNGYRLANKQLSFNSMAIDATLRAFNISITQYENGLIPYQRLLTSVEKLTRNEDNYAVIKGNISNQAIALYKALGGGWQTSNDHGSLNIEDIKQMKERTDWGNYLDKDSLNLKRRDRL